MSDKQDDDLKNFDSRTEHSVELWKAKAEGERDARMENTIVKRLLKGCPADQAANFLQLQRDLLGPDYSHSLTFSSFLEDFPEFPVWLHCHKIPYVFQTSIADLYDRSKRKRNKIYRNYLAASRDRPDFWESRPFGLVFEWLHSGGQYKIFHDYQLSLAAHPYRERLLEETRLQFAILEAGERRVYWLDNFEDFLGIIGWLDRE